MCTLKKMALLKSQEKKKGLLRKIGSTVQDARIAISSDYKLQAMSKTTSHQHRLHIMRHWFDKKLHSKHILVH